MNVTQKNEVIPFDFDTHQLRIINIDNYPFFIAKDVCEILELKEISKALVKIPDSYKLTRKIIVSGQHREMYLVNEAGLYLLMMRSNKPSAKQFQNWIANEVLPSIRKTGSYQVTETMPQLELNLQPVETVRVLPNELYEELMTIESKAKRMRLMKLYKAIAAKGQVI